MAALRTLFSPRWRWLTISVMWLAVVTLAQFGLAAIRPPISPWDRIYMIPDLFTIGFSDELAAQDWRIQTARFIGPLVFASTFLVATAGIFREQLGRIRVRFARRHVVVAGLGDKGLRLGTSYLEAGRRVVAVDRDPSNPNLATMRRRGATVLTGDATDPQLLGDAGVSRAADLIAVCGDDSTNASVLATAIAMSGGDRGGRLSVAVHLGDARLARLLRTRELGGGHPQIRTEFFNVDQRGARLWLTDVDPFRPDPLGRPPHLVVVGLGPLGASVVVHAVQRWHADPESDGTRTMQITAVDADAAAWAGALSLEHRRFAEWAEIETIDLDPAYPAGGAVEEFRRLLAAGSVTDVFVALDDASVSVTAALLIRHGLGGNRAAVNVQTGSGAALATLITEPGSAEHPVPIRPYDAIDRTCTAEAISGGTNEQVAMALHDDYLARARSEGRQGAAVRPWDELSDQDRDANRGAAAGLVDTLRLAGYLPVPALGWDHEAFRFTDTETELLAAAEHDRWMVSRRTEGWRHGDARDDVRKINPLLVPWAELDEEDRRFTRNSMASVPRMLARSGFELVAINDDRPDGPVQPPS